MADTDTAETLKRLIRLWAILTNTSQKTVIFQLQRLLRVDTFLDNEQAQKLAIIYLRGKLEGDE